MCVNNNVIQLNNSIIIEYIIMYNHDSVNRTTTEQQPPPLATPPNPRPPDPSHSLSSTDERCQSTKTFFLRQLMLRSLPPLAIILS